MYKFEKHILVLYNSFKLLQKHNCLTNLDSNELVFTNGNIQNLKLLNYFYDIIYIYQLLNKKIKLVKVKKSISNFKIFEKDLIFTKSTLKKKYFYNFIKILQINNVFMKKKKKSFGFGIRSCYIFEKLLNIFPTQKINLIGFNCDLKKLNNNFRILYKLSK